MKLFKVKYKGQALISDEKSKKNPFSLKVNCSQNKLNVDFIYVTELE